MEYISTKQNKTINLKLENVNDNSYMLLALSNTDEIMGSAYFSVNYKERKVWLKKIETDEKYQNQGVGKALIDVLEFFTINQNMRYIEGKFYPDNEYAKPFYLKNGYEIYKEDYETFVGKFLNAEEVLSNAKDKIINYEIENNSEELSF